ncbi:MAG TPA: hypothetical protein DCQ90_02980 [Erysipelotrichaceae bacterium]|nr:hypothetical protein [Erysipelotrichaceae bacterium]
MKRNIPVFDGIFVLLGLVLIYILNFVNLNRLPIDLPDVTVLILSCVYVLGWMIFSFVAGRRRGKIGWYEITFVWIILPALLIGFMTVLASFQSITNILSMIMNLLYVNVLRGFNDLTTFGIDLFEYFSDKGYPVIPAILCLVSYGIGRLFPKPRKRA